MTSIGVARKELGRFVLRCRATTVPTFYRSASSISSPGFNSSLVRVYKPPIFFHQPCSVASDRKLSTHSGHYYAGFLCFQLLQMITGMYSLDIQQISEYILNHYELLQTLEAILKFTDIDFGFDTEKLLERVNKLPSVAADKLTDILLGAGFIKLAEKLGLKNKNANNTSFKYDVGKGMKIDIQKVHIDHLNIYGPTVYLVIKDLEMPKPTSMDEDK